MPFQSEKQRRYLWANEPEIARDWTDTYGSRIQSQDGGIMRIPFAEGKTSIPEWNLAIKKQELELATTDEERAAIQKQIDTIEANIGTGANTLLGSGEVPTEGFWGWLSEKMGMSQAEGAKPTAAETAAVERSSPVDEREIQSILEREEAQSNMQQMMNPNYLKSMFGEQRIPKALTPVDDLEAQNVIPTFEDYEQREEFDERVRNMPTIQDEGIPASERWRNFLSKVTRQPYRPSSGFTPAYYGSGAPRLNKQGQPLGYSAARLNQMNALGGYYSEPAREARRIKTRGTNILKRAGEGKPIGNVANILGQYGYTETPSGGLSFDPAGHEGSPTAGAGYSRSDDSWSASPFVRGGLASLWRR